MTVESELLAEGQKDQIQINHKLLNKTIGQVGAIPGQA